MSAATITQIAPVGILAATAEESQWSAVQTRCRWEKKVTQQLQGKSVETFLPTYRTMHRWSDRRKLVELPILSGYVFTRLVLTPQAHMSVLQTFGVISFIAFNGKIPSIPDGEIENLRRLSDNNVPCFESQFIAVGQRVRIRGGCLDGLECVLVSRQGEKSLMLSIEPIHRYIRISVDDYALDPI
jgi:transcription antitermination factor NusG